MVLLPSFSVGSGYGVVFLIRSTSHSPKNDICTFNVRGYFLGQGRFASTLVQPSGVHLRFDFLAIFVATFVTQISHLPFCVLPHLSSPWHLKLSLTRLLPFFCTAPSGLKVELRPSLGPNTGLASVSCPFLLILL